MSYKSKLVYSEFSIGYSSIKLRDLFIYAKENEWDKIIVVDRNNLKSYSDLIKLSKEFKIEFSLGIHLTNQKIIILPKNKIGFKNISNISSSLFQNNNFVIDDNNLIILKEEEVTIANTFNNKKDSLKILMKIFETEIKSISLEKAPLFLKEISTKREINKKPVPTFSDNSIKLFKDLLLKSLKKYYFKNSNINFQDYLKRLNFEISVIEELKFVDYFLIMEDMVSWCKNNNIYIGPGRGSAPGSLVSFLLNITKVDPIKFNLLFERFLNPKRITMPDIDIDIQSDKRIQVVEYMFNKYGKENCAQIITFSRIISKSALKDIARLKGYPVVKANLITKKIPNGMGLKESYKKVAKFRAEINKNDENKSLFEMALLIEGYVRQFGTHAAGIVLSNEKLSNIAEITTSNSGFNQISVDGSVIEEIGLLKFDLLALSNLTSMIKIIDEIFINYKKKLNIDLINLDDSKTLFLLNSGNTNGIFQVESYDMKKTLKDVGIDNFEDLVAVISLYRPGPMAFIPSYIKRKKNEEEIPKIHPSYDKIVENTYGIIIYQEQIMQILQNVSGFDFSEADIMRRAISKKKESLILENKDKFIKGALKNNVSEKDANIIFAAIEKFASYGFNRSHAVSYGIISFSLAYLKSRFPIEFYTAVIGSSSAGQSSLKKYSIEAMAQEIKIISPEINLSTNVVYNELQNKRIILPFNYIKGLGDSFQKQLIEVRNNTPFI
ncbi:MAG: DNA polymerase III subunit alpha, partial [Mollicutes bacterium PWAP]|nr:DNA polymerase III subunit alpha [Mollicutes bacterium PWAP]